MPDWDQFARNLAYGALHRPAQVLRWFGEQFDNQAAPVGQAMIQAANQVDSEALSAFQPYNPASEWPGSLPGPPPLTSPLTYTPPPDPWHADNWAWYYYWKTSTGTIIPYGETGAGWGPGSWVLQIVTMPPPV